MTAPQTTSASYEVGYRKPPRHTQFQKGQSGNPGGRPRRSLAGRLEELALREAYRTTIVMEDGHAVPMPVIQAVLRGQLESATSGNVRAQRDILAMIRDIERARSVVTLSRDGGADDAVVDDDDVVDTDDADANEGDDNGRPSIPPPLAGEGRVGARAARSCCGKDPTTALHPKSGSSDFGAKHVEFGDCRIRLDGEGEESADAAGADHHDAGGVDDDERQQADGIDTYGERQAEREPTAPPAVSAPRPENAAAPPAGRTPSSSAGSGSGQRRGVLPRHNGPERSAGVQPARPQPGRRRSGPALNAGKIRGGRSGGLRRSPGRTKSGPDPAQAVGGHARAPAAPAERDEKLKTRC